MRRSLLSLSPALTLSLGVLLAEQAPDDILGELPVPTDVTKENPMKKAAAKSIKGWPPEVVKISYPCSADQTEQPALFYRPEKDEPVPLLVGLHTWSGNYLQATSAPYARWCIDKGWVFIHPDFRGPNTKPEGCGSELAVMDIVDAVSYAKEQAKVDTKRIYLVGVSGGGHAAMLMAARAPEIWAGVSAWVGISDLQAWHRECKEAGRGYYKHVELSCGGVPGTDAAADEECRRRSPLTYLKPSLRVPLDINAGIQDGHRGSVPISHSLNAFNAVAKKKDHLTPEEIEHFVTKIEMPPHLKGELVDADYGKKTPLFRRESGSVRVTIFQGGHEIIFNAALRWLEKQKKAE